MKTALLLLIIVFAPFIWFIYKMIRYTQRTIGDESPLYSEQSYEISASDYFVKFYKLLLAIVFFQMIMLVFITAQAAVQQSSPFLFLFSIAFAVFAIYVGFIFYFDWQYWTITRDVRVTLNPAQPSITVTTPDHTSVLTPSNVIQIEHHLRETSNSKDPLGGYGFFLFYDTDGNVTQLNNIFLIHVEFLQRFFKDVPSTIVWRRFPWVAENAEKPKSQNFAA